MGVNGVLEHLRIGIPLTGSDLLWAQRHAALVLAYFARTILFESKAAVLKTRLLSGSMGWQFPMV